ncbi:hypothetical protein V8F06_012587 [Rhypophila decipiens]
MPITDLAPELVRHCLSHLDSNDLRNTSLVSRDWLEPSMEFYWAEASLYPYLDGNVLKDLDTLLGSNSHIPRTLRALVIDESEVDDDDDDEEDEEIVHRKQWIEGLSNILGHFPCIKRLTIGALNLTRFPRDIRRRLLNNISVSETLVIRYLKVAELSDITSFIFDNPQLRFLGLGSIEIAKPQDGRIFINTGPGLCEADMQHESAPPLWEALDAHLADMEGLEQVTFTQVISGCLAGLMSIPGAGNGGLFDVFRDKLEDTVNGLLPRCKEKRITTIE